jgi:hypothetical protein
MNDVAALERLAREDPAAFKKAVREVGKRAFVPHSGGQQTVLTNHTRFRTLAAGRRWGKTKLAAHEVISRARRPNQMIWWVANTYKNVGRGYREVVNQLPPSWLAKPAPSYTSTNKILQLKNGTMIEFYSGGSPDALAGEGVDFVVVDEGALIADMVWQQLIRPTLMDTNGDALIISTPRGHNWFWELWRLGQEEREGYASWQFPQTMNPYVDAAETESARLELPEIIFRQEIMAEFLAAGASIFGLGIEHPGAIVDEIVDPIGNIFVGVDLAKKEDFTVISGAREVDRMPVYFEKFNQMDWPTIQNRVKVAVEGLEEEPDVEGVTVLVDSTGVGEVVYDNLTAAGMDIKPITFTNQNKEQMARLLAADLEKGEAHILGDMKPEFESYEFSLTPSGKYQFEAATGHDDMVSAKMLEHWGLVHEGGQGIEILDVNREGPESEEAGWVERMVREAVIPVADSPLDMMRRPEVWESFSGQPGSFCT